MATPNLPVNINTFYGAPFIGLLIASFMSGVVTIQAYVYYRSFPQDPIKLKSLVALICILDITHLVAITYWVYYHTITHWGDLGVFDQFTWSWGVEIILNTLILFICQSFLIYRFKIISNGNWWITSVLALLTLMQLVSGLTSAATGLVRGVTLSKVATPQSKTLGSVWLFSGAVDDALIAISLSYYLHKRSSMNSPIVDRLIIYISSTGALTSVLAFANIATYLAMPSTFVHLALNFPLGRVYTNSLLSSLNMREGRHSGRTSVPSNGGFAVNIQKTTITTVDRDTRARRGRSSKHAEEGSNSLHVKWTEEP